MNIAVINVKDLFRYILKFLSVIAIIIIISNIIKGIRNVRDVRIKETIKTNTSKINEKTFIECLDISMPIISYEKNEKITDKLVSNTNIITIGTGLLDKKILKNTDLIINEEELNIDDVEELKTEISELPKEVTMENVSENNISPKVTDTYGSVKIDNQSDYDITESMLIPDVEITNKKDILIYHTHTCESYTQSPRL